jgi:hypothetical protein
MQSLGELGTLGQACGHHAGDNDPRPSRATQLVTSPRSLHTGSVRQTQEKAKIAGDPNVAVGSGTPASCVSRVRARAARVRPVSRVPEAGLTPSSGQQGLQACGWRPAPCL